MSGIALGPLEPIKPVPVPPGAEDSPREPRRWPCCYLIGGLPAPDAASEVWKAWEEWTRRRHEDHHARCDCECPHASRL